MSAVELSEAISAVVNRLVSLAAADEALRPELRRLAEAVLAATQPAAAPTREVERADGRGEPEIAAADSGAADVDDGLTAPAFGRDKRSVPPVGRGGQPAHKPVPAERRSSPVSPPERREPLPPLTLGGTPATAEPAYRPPRPEWQTADEDDLSQIIARCRLKAEGSRWAATRQRLMAESVNYATEIEPRDRDIISRARMLPDCFLWMNHPSGPSPSNLKLYDDMAGCFDAVADALSILKQIEDEPDVDQVVFERCLDLLAEAQSALRAAIAAIDGPVDRDQLRAFNRLRRATAERQIYVQRYMRADDPADPTAWEDLCARIEMLDMTLQESSQKTKQRRKLLGKVRHKLTLITEEPEQAEAHCAILAETIDELVQGGLPPSNRELRDLLLPVIDDLPELPATPPGFELVLREIDRYLATTPSPPGTPSAAGQATPEVRLAARALEGKSIVLIGGENRPGAAQSLESAFRLKELIWVATREHQSIDGFEAPIARTDVAVVLLAIRWTSHSYGDVKYFCEKHGKPLVRLPAGYNPNQVAVQILSQCGDKLGVTARSGVTAAK